MKRHSLVGSLLTATLATGLLLVGSASASAQNTDPTPTQPVTGSTDITTAQPPVFSTARVTCRDDGSLVVAKLHNPNKTLQEYMVGISAGDIYYDYVVQVAPHGSELVEFGGLPNATYLLQAQNVAGDVVAHARVHVQCKVTPPTPTGTPTGTPTAPPSETPTTSPTTSTSSATTAVPSTPVAVPTAVDAGFAGPAAHDDSNHGRTIAGAGLLAAVGITLGLSSLLVRRRRGLHQG